MTRDEAITASKTIEKGLARHGWSREKGDEMAARKYGIDFGASEETVTRAIGSATTNGIELTVHGSK